MKDLIDVVFILDKSGSMFPLKEDAILGYNSLIEDLKKKDSNVLVTTVLFNNSISLVYERANIKEVCFLDESIYKTEGSTALLDAVGFSINMLERIKDKGKVLFYITTDGMENSSKEYTYKTINKLIEAKKEESWQFNFLASGIDEKEFGKKIGIDSNRIHKIEASRCGQRKMFMSIEKMILDEIKE